MSVPIDSYSLSRSRQGALFQRNPVCALCFRVCKELCQTYGSIHFDLLRSMQAADSLCTCLVENAWEPPDVVECHQWLEEHLNNNAEVMCACATLSLSISAMTDAPEPLRSLGQDLRCLVHGEANRIYTNLYDAVWHEHMSFSATNYGTIQPKPANWHDKMEIVPIPPKQPKRMQATQNIQHNAPVHNGPVFNGPVFNGPVFNGPVYQAPVTQNYGAFPSSSVSPECHSDTSSSGAPGVRPENDSRTKKLFLTPDGDEDFTRTEEERNRFLNFLSEHHWSQRQIDCSRDNPINKSIVCFYAKWKHLKYIHPRTGPAPLLRFLTDTCALQRAAEDRAISAILGKMLKSDYDPDIFYDVCDYFN